MSRTFVPRASRIASAVLLCAVACSAAAQSSASGGPAAGDLPSILERKLRDAGAVGPGDKEPADYNVDALRHLNKGRDLFFKSRRYEEGLREIDAALAIDQRSPLAYNVVYLYYMLTKREPMVAVTRLEAGVRHCPQSGMVRFNLGQARAAAGSPSDALRDYEQVLRLGVPFAAEVHYSRGNAYEKLGNLAAAVEAWQEAIRRDNAHLDSRHNLVVAYVKLGRRADAKKEAEALRDLDTKGREGAWAREALKRL